MRHAYLLAAAALSFTLLGACSSDPAPAPTPPALAVEFPSAGAAVSVQTVEIFVFDAGEDAGDLDCEALILKRKTGQDLAPLEDTGPLPLCQVFEGTRWMRGGGSASSGFASGPHSMITVSGANRLYFAVAQRNAKDYLVGCTQNPADDGSVSIQLDLIDATVDVPPTTCQSLSQKCQNGC